jgi:hypothetical protein
MIQCALCNHSDPVEIVSHIKSCHDLKNYLSVFPELPVVAPDLFTAIENSVFFQYEDETSGLQRISKEDRELLIVNARNHAHLRSDIAVSPDF